MQQNPEISATMPSTFTLHVYRRVVDQETGKVKGYRFYLQRKDDEQAIEAYTSRPAFMAALRKKQRQQKREATGAEAPKENSTSIPVSAMEDEQGAKDSAPDAVRGGGGHTPSAFNGRSSQFIRTGPRKCPYCARVFASQHALDIHFYRNTACRARFKAEQGPRSAPKRRSQSASSSEALPRKRPDPSHHPRPPVWKDQTRPASPPALPARTAPTDKQPAPAVFTTILARCSPARHCHRSSDT